VFPIDITPKESGPQLLDVESAARRLSIHPDTLRSMLRRGDIEGVKIGVTWRVSLDALNRYIESATVKNKSA
jgi:excisionase family DNA binding protein